MEVWTSILFYILAVTVFIILLSTVFNWLVFWYSQKHAEKELDRNIKKIKKMLPGVDCGGCGCENCEEYARAIFYGQKDLNLCVHGDIELERKLDNFMEKFNQYLSGEENSNP